MKSINPKLIQIFGDAIIPILGFLFWDWGLYFILLFYFLDLLVREVLTVAKSKKIIEFQSLPNENIIFPLLKSLTLFITIVSTFQGISILLIDNFDWKKEIIAFWTYQDLGIQQGYILVPLLILAGFMQYKNEFILLKEYERLSFKDLWKSHFQTKLILLSCAAILLGISTFYQISETFVVFAIILGSLGVNIFLLKKKSN